MTDAELAILSLLNDQPRTDLAIHTEIDARGLRRWTAIGVSSVYYILEKLMKQGLVEQIGGNTITLERSWKITSAGFGVLQTAVADLLATPHPPGRSIELGIANLHVLKPSQVEGALLNYRHELNARLAHTQQELARERAAANDFQTLALYDHTRVMLEAELKWIIQFIADYQALGLQDPVIPIPEPRPIPRIQQVILPEDPDSVHKETTIQRPSSRPKVPGVSSE